MSNKQIGRELGISDGTVKIYVRNLLQKLSLHSRLELAAWVHNGTSVRDEERH
jgi:two-component system nitrate/nitrite response regulator NarL